MAKFEKETKFEADFVNSEWTAEEEVQLFLALNGIKPFGVNKHFFMACIVDRLSKTLNRKITSEAVWSQLKTMYNLKALDEQEPLPFPNEQTHFTLPESEFNLKSKQTDDESDTGSNKTSSEISTTSNTAIKPLGTKSNPAKDSENKKSNKSSDTTSDTSVKQLPVKRTRGSLSIESPVNTPPSSSQQQSAKRRRF